MVFINLKKVVYRLYDYSVMLRDKLLNFPHEIKIEITYDCNKNCHFCFNSNTTQGSIQETKETDFVHMINCIKQQGIKRIRLTGGEPTMSPDFLKILKYSKEIGLIVKVNTNGDLTNNKTISYLKKYSDEILFSIHDVDISFSKINLMKQFVREGVIVKISTIGTKQNIRNFDSFNKIIKKINPDFWYWNYPIPHGKEMISWDDIHLLSKMISNNKNKTKTVGIRFPLCDLDRSELKTIMGCTNCGPYDHLVINPFGEIHLCNSFDFNLGDANFRNIMKVWRHNTLVKKFKSHQILPSECQECSKLKYCNGGCRYSAFVNHENISSLHPLYKKQI